MFLKSMARIFCVLFILMLSACNLPEVTPPVEESPTSESSFNTTPAVSQTEPPVAQSNPILITDANVNKLTVVQKIPVTNPLQVEWANDNQTFSVLNQTSDAGGTQLFGVTTFDVPSLATRYLYTLQNGRITAVAADGRTVAVISDDWLSYSLVDIGAGNIEVASGTTGFRIANVTFSPDLKYAAITKAEAWEVVLHSFVDNSEVRLLTGFETAAPIFIAGFSASPAWMVWFARGTAQLQDVETGALSPVFSHEDFITAIAVSPDSSILATAAGKTVNGTFSPAITLWDAALGTELRTIISPAFTITFSPDGKLLAAGADDALSIWRVADGTLLGTFPGHLATIGSVKFSPDGKYIVTAGYDNQLYLWQVLE